MISQMKFAGKKLIFYGDDTWIKLFPEHFIRTDGTTSFFVTDYTEVRKEKEAVHCSVDLKLGILLVFW